MTTAGWITMIISVGSVTLLCFWTMARVLRGHKADRDLGHIEPVNEDETDRR
jgi:hypothetical protein